MKFAVTFALLGSILSTFAHAGNATGKVGQVLVGRMGNQVYIELLNTQFGGWPCASTHPGGFRYAFLLTSQGAREMLATVLTAQASGQRLQVVGSGSCSIDASLEDAQYVVLQP